MRARWSWEVGGADMDRSLRNSALAYSLHLTTLPLIFSEKQSLLWRVYNPNRKDRVKEGKDYILILQMQNWAMEIKWWHSTISPGIGESPSLEVFNELVGQTPFRDGVGLLDRASGQGAGLNLSRSLPDWHFCDMMIIMFVETDYTCKLLRFVNISYFFTTLVTYDFPVRCISRRKAPGDRNYFLLKYCQRFFMALVAAGLICICD